MGFFVPGNTLLAPTLISDCADVIKLLDIRLASSSAVLHMWTPVNDEKGRFWGKTRVRNISSIPNCGQTVNLCLDYSTKRIWPFLLAKKLKVKGRR